MQSWLGSAPVVDESLAHPDLGRRAVAPAPPLFACDALQFPGTSRQGNGEESMTRLRRILTPITLSGALAAIAGVAAAKEVKTASCLPGQTKSDDTDGHCCWPG